jgi:hypothetical protein
MGFKNLSKLSKAIVTLVSYIPGTAVEKLSTGLALDRRPAYRFFDDHDGCVCC